MEKSVTQLEEGKQLYTSMQVIGIASIGVLFGSIAFPISFALSLFYLSYFYMRDKGEGKAAGIGILLGSLTLGFFTTYFYTLGFTIFFICIHAIHLWNKNMYGLLPFLCALLTIPYSLYSYGFHIHVLFISLGIYILMKENSIDYGWIQKQLIFTSSMYGVWIYAVTLFLCAFFPIHVQSNIVLIGFLMIALFCDSKVFVVLSILQLLLFPALSIPMEILLVFGMITLWKQEKKVLLSGIILYGFYLHSHTEILLLMVICFFAVLFYREDFLPFQMVIEEVEEPTISAQSVLKRQIQNFSNIFQSMAQYYENISSVQSHMLSEMAMALKYSADTLKKLDVQENQKSRILKAVEGYQYDMSNLSIAEAKEGSIVLDFDIRSIQRNEIQTTLLPLMEVLTHERLKITEVKHQRFSNGYHHVTMENHVPYQIDAYADSQKNMFESSGDTFSIFRFRNTTICMISDGMGSGDKAAASSRLITNIFQRMVFSGISKVDSIRCINKLLQSDAYATLDVICFDMCEGKAYIFKSAACPTYLLRDHQVYEVSGSSLPVGIISTMEPACFVADLKEGDEYLMVSDGIYMDEIYKWIEERKGDCAKEDCEDLMKIIRQRNRNDDSTAVLSRVQLQS